MLKFLFILGRELCARTCNDDHKCLNRTAAVKPVTGSPITGWKAAQ